MAWRLALSLQALRAEVLALHPGTTVWDIGDEAHVVSDHRPNEDEVVCATDTLPDGGLDLGWYAERVRQAGIRGHPAPKYVIYSRRIASRNGGWTWRVYTGSNPHTGHVHVSVGVGPDGQSTGPYDDTSPWGLQEESDVSAEETWAVDVWVSDWIMDRWGEAWPDRRIATGPLLMAAYGQSRAGHEAATTALREQRAGFAAVLAAQAGGDVAEAVRAELDRAAERERAERAAELGEVTEALRRAAEERAALAELVRQGQSGELEAAEVIRLMGEKLTAAAVAPAGDQG